MINIETYCEVREQSVSTNRNPAARAHFPPTVNLFLLHDVTSPYVMKPFDIWNEIF